MLDLSKMQRLYEIKWIDGEVIKLKTPTMKDLKFMEDILKKDNKEIDLETGMEFLHELLFRFFNNNANNRKFTKKTIEDNFNYAIAMMVIEDFTNFLYDRLGEYQSPVCQVEQGKN